MKVGLVFPHQLLEQNPLLGSCDTIYMVEEYLFFRYYRFHKQKIAFHRASMKFYADFLLSKNIKVIYIEAHTDHGDIRKLLPFLKSQGIDHISFVDTTDTWLEKRINEVCTDQKISITKHTSPLFLNTPEELDAYFANKKRFFQTDFYKNQRQKRKILVDTASNPIGGKWTFDDENRLKYPKGKIPPKTTPITQNDFYHEAITYTEKHFPDHYGRVNVDFLFPTTFDESKVWLQQFFEDFDELLSN